MDRLRRNGLAAILLLASLGYPAAGYLGRAAAPPRTSVALVLLLMRERTVTLAVTAARGQRGLLIASAVVLVVLAALDPPVAATAYAVLVSAGLAAVFGISLLYPPRLVEPF